MNKTDVIIRNKILVKLRNVSKLYRMGDSIVNALRNLNLEIYEGEFLVVIGPSGSGKTTLLNMIGGMDSPSSGSIEFDGEELSGAGEKKLTAYRRNHIGFVFQFFNLIPTLTAIENVEVATEKAENPLNPLEILSRFGLADRANHFPSQLSGGEQQRVATARALAGNPSIILCDEPTGALDTTSSMKLMELLSGLRDEYNKTIILITHDLSLTPAGDRVVTLRDGSIK